MPFQIILYKNQKQAKIELAFISGSRLPVSLDNYIALASALIALIGLLFVGLQLRAGLKQQQAQSLVEIFSTNRELLEHRPFK